MKKQKAFLKIEHPCGQDWSSMKEDVGGKFCTSCEKNVIDFTSLSDDELIRTIRASKTMPCGRFRESQLNRLIQSNSRTSNPYIYKILASLLFLGATGNSNAQSRPEEIKIVSPAEKENQTTRDAKGEKMDKSTSGLLENVVNSLIINVETKRPVPLATIHLVGTQFYVNTDSQGVLNCIIPDSLLSDTMRFEILSDSSFFWRSFIISKKDLPYTKDILVGKYRWETMYTGMLTDSFLEENDNQPSRKKKWWRLK